MKNKDSRIEEVQQTIDKLIHTASSYDIDVLERIYHDNMQVIMIDTDDCLNTADKSAFKELFQSKKEAGDSPMNTWAKYHRIDVKNNTAHVLLSRKNNLNGTNMKLTLSIDLIYENDCWQVIREVIFLHPENN